MVRFQHAGSRKDRLKNVQPRVSRDIQMFGTTNNQSPEQSQVQSFDLSPDVHQFSVFNQATEASNSQYYTPLDKVVQHTPFGFQDIDIPVPPVGWGEEVDVSLPPHADLLSTCWLCIQLPAMYVENCYWINSVGHYLVNSVELVVDNVVLATHTFDKSLFGDALDHKRRNYSKLVTPPLCRPGRASWTAHDTVYVKLDMWFCHGYYNALPMMLLENSTVKLRIRLNGQPGRLDPSGLSFFTRIIGEGDNRFQARNKSPFTKQALLEFAKRRPPRVKLIGRYIHLDTADREGLANPTRTPTWTFNRTLSRFYEKHANLELPVMANTPVKEIALVFYTDYDHTGGSSSYDPFNQVYVRHSTDPWGKPYFVWPDKTITDGSQLDIKGYVYQEPDPLMTYTKHTVTYSTGSTSPDVGFYRVYSITQDNGKELVTLIHISTGKIATFVNFGVFRDGMLVMGGLTDIIDINHDGQYTTSGSSGVSRDQLTVRYGANDNVLVLTAVGWVGAVITSPPVAIGGPYSIQYHDSAPTTDTVGISSISIYKTFEAGDTVWLGSTAGQIENVNHDGQYDFQPSAGAQQTVKHSELRPRNEFQIKDAVLAYNVLSSGTWERVDIFLYDPNGSEYQVSLHKNRVVDEVDQTDLVIEINQPVTYGVDNTYGVIQGYRNGNYTILLTDGTTDTVARASVPPVVGQRVLVTDDADNQITGAVVTALGGTFTVRLLEDGFVVTENVPSGLIQPIGVLPDDRQFVSFEDGVQNEESLLFEPPHPGSTNNRANDASASHSFHIIIQIKDNVDEVQYTYTEYKNLEEDDGNGGLKVTRIPEVVTTKYAGQIFTNNLSRTRGVWKADDDARWFPVSYLSNPNGATLPGKGMHKPHPEPPPNGYYSVENLEDNHPGSKIYLRGLDNDNLDQRHVILNVRLPFDDDVKITLTSEIRSIGPYNLRALGSVGDADDARTMVPRNYSHTSDRTRFRRSSGRHDRQVVYSDDNPIQAYPAQWREWLATQRYATGLTAADVPNPNSLDNYHNPSVTHGRTRQRARNQFTQSPVNLELFRIKFGLDPGSHTPSGHITFDNRWMLNVISAKKKKYNIEVFFGVSETMMIANGQLMYVPISID